MEILSLNLLIIKLFLKNDFLDLHNLLKINNQIIIYLLLSQLVNPKDQKISLNQYTIHGYLQKLYMELLL